MARRAQKRKSDRWKKQRKEQIAFSVIVSAIALTIYLFCLFPDTFEDIADYFAFHMLQPLLALLGSLVTLLLLTSPIWAGLFFVRSGVKVLEERKAVKETRDFLDRQPRTSLLRASTMPSPPREALLRPANTACEDDPQHLLRATEK